MKKRLSTLVGLFLLLILGLIVYLMNSSTPYLIAAAVVLAILSAAIMIGNCTMAANLSWFALGALLIGIVLPLISMDTLLYGAQRLQEAVLSSTLIGLIILLLVHLFTKNRKGLPTLILRYASLLVYILSLQVRFTQDVFVLANPLWSILLIHFTYDFQGWINKQTLNRSISCLVIGVVIIFCTELLGIKPLLLGIFCLKECPFFTIITAAVLGALVLLEGFLQPKHQKEVRTNTGTALLLWSLQCLLCLIFPLFNHPLALVPAPLLLYIFCEGFVSSLPEKQPYSFALLGCTATLALLVLGKCLYQNVIFALYMLFLLLGLFICWQVSKRTKSGSVPTTLMGQLGIVTYAMAFQVYLRSNPALQLLALFLLGSAWCFISFMAQRLDANAPPLAEGVPLSLKKLLIVFPGLLFFMSAVHILLS